MSDSANALAIQEQIVQYGWKMSPTIGKLTEALAAAQLEYQPLTKDSANPYYDSKYADLAAVIGATQKALAKHGLVILQFPIIEIERQEAGVASLLSHSSGEWVSTDLLLPATGLGKDGKEKFNAQTIGIAVTYSRRYSYQPLAGVAAEVDDDANAISGHGKSQTSSRGTQGRESRQSVAGDDRIAVLAGKPGWFALTGKGLKIIMANIPTPENHGMKREGQVWTIESERLAGFTTFCLKHGVELDTSAVDGTGQPAGTSLDAPNPTLVKANISPHESSTQSTDPIILDVTFMKSNPKGSKPKSSRVNTLEEASFLLVKWNGKEHFCFDKKLFPGIVAAKNHPAYLERAQTKYAEIIRINKVDDMDLTDGFPVDDDLGI